MSVGCTWVHSHVSLSFYHSVMRELNFDKCLCRMPSSAVQHSWPLESGKLVPGCVSVWVWVCECFFGSLKHPVAAVLHICPTAVTTGKPQLGLQSKLKWSEVEFALFIYSSHSQTVNVTTENCQQVLSWFLFLLKCEKRTIGGPSQIWQDKQMHRNRTSEKYT